MYYGQIITADAANGPGIRLSLFVSGCTNHCKGCFQPQTWNFEYGKEFTKETQDFILKEASKPYYRGLTILGGEPLEPCNQYGILPLLEAFKAQNPNKDVWIFTGFTYEDDLLPGGRKYTPVTDRIFDLTDVIVDGRFVEEEKDIRLNFRGSRNQRIIDIVRTRQEGAVVLSQLNN